jgi:hypothetical protein
MFTQISGNPSPFILPLRNLSGIARRRMDAASQVMHCHAANAARLVAMRVLNPVAITLIE